MLEDSLRLLVSLRTISREGFGSLSLSLSIDMTDLSDSPSDSFSDSLSESLVAAAFLCAAYSTRSLSSLLSVSSGWAGGSGESEYFLFSVTVSRIPYTV